MVCLILMILKLYVTHVEGKEEHEQIEIGDSGDSSLESKDTAARSWSLLFKVLRLLIDFDLELSYHILTIANDLKITVLSILSKLIGLSCVICIHSCS